MRHAFVVSLGSCQQCIGSEICPWCNVFHLVTQQVETTLAKPGFDFQVALIHSGNANMAQWHNTLLEKKLQSQDVVVLYASGLCFLDNDNNLALPMEATGNKQAFVVIKQLIDGIRSCGVESAAIVLDLTAKGAHQPRIYEEYIMSIQTLFQRNYPNYFLMCSVQQCLDPAATSCSASYTHSAQAKRSDAASTSQTTALLTCVWLHVMSLVQARNQTGAVLMSRIIELICQNESIRAMLQNNGSCLTVQRGRREVMLFSYVSAALTCQSRQSVPIQQPALNDAAALSAEQLLRVGDDRLELDDWQGATEIYKKVLMVEPQGQYRAVAYSRLGTIKAHQKQFRVAERMFARAVEVNPQYKPALQQLASVLREQQQFVQAGQQQKRLYWLLDNEQDKFHCLMVAAHDFHCGTDLHAVIETLQLAQQIQPNNVQVLAQLAQAYEKTSNIDQLIDTLEKLALVKQDPIERAAGLVIAAEYAQKQGVNETRAFAMLEHALDIDVHTPRAWSYVEAYYRTRHDYSSLDRAIVKQAERLYAIGDNQHAAKLWHQAVTVRKHKLNRLIQAIAAADKAIMCDGTEVTYRLELAELLVEAQHREQAIQVLEIALLSNSSCETIFHRLYQLFIESRQADRAFCAASSLVGLHAATPDENEYYQRYRPRSLVNPKSSLDDKSWNQLYPDGFSHLVTNVIQCIADYAIDYKIALLESKDLLTDFDSSLRLDPTVSTVSVARVFSWVCKVLNIPLADLYIQQDVPSAIAAVPSRRPSVVIGKGALNGLSLLQLAFLVARDASFFRKAHYILILYPTVKEFTDLFRAAIFVVKPDAIAAASSNEQVADLRGYLDSHITPQDKQQLLSGINELEKQHQQVDLTSWAQAVATASSRAALLVCGDIAVVRQILQSDDRMVGGITAAQCLEDLMAFSVTQTYCNLRCKLGIAVIEP